jgi:aerobic-type carbon monoxide dehydrogenase small subunit (CoxS/CutS family)
VCGACTVLIDGASARSCLTLAVQAEGACVTTVEGLHDDGSIGDLQRAMSRHGGLQCGFCTPGFLVSAEELLGERPEPDEAEVREALSGHICRCTGYQGIVQAVLDVARERRRAAGSP